MGTVSKGHLFGMLVVVAVLAGAWVAGGARRVDAQTNPLSVIEEATLAVNAGDTDAFMALWVDDGGVFEMSACYAIFGPDGCVGPEAIRLVAGGFIEDSLVWTWTQDLQVSGDTVSAPAEFRIGALAEMGVERVIVSNAEWDVVDGKITRGHFDDDLTDADTVKWRRAFYAAVGAQLPDDALSVIEQGTVIVNARDVDAWMAFWADDGVFEIDPCFAVFGPDGCVGLETIRAVSSVFLEDSLVWTWAGELQVSGNTVSGRAEMRVGALAALGIERVLFDATWDVVDAKIARGRFDVVLSDPDSVKWQTAIYASVAGPPPATGNAGLAATDRGGPTWPWQLLAGAAVLALVLSARMLAARRPAA